MRPLIGAIVPRTAPNIARQILKNLFLRLDALGYNLLTFAGGPIYDHNLSHNPDNFIYKYINDFDLKGLIVLGGALGQYLSNDELSLFCKNFNKVPVLNISITIDGQYSMEVDNYNGMYEIVSHLIKDHKMKNIAFVKGPENHIEAELRFDGYKKALEDNNIEFREEYVIPGEFTVYYGEIAVQVMLDKRKLDLDAIVCADDDTAKGVYTGLKERNISIPGDIAVTGFDDSEVAASLSPSLSTVSQNIEIQGSYAADLIHNILRGSIPNKIIKLPTTLRLRQSCGCLEKELVDTTSNPIAESIKEKKHTRQDALSIFADYIDENELLGEKDAIDIFESLENSIYRKETFLFIQKMSAHIEASFEYEDTVLRWQHILTLLRSCFQLILDQKDLVFFEDLFHKARVYVSQNIRQQEFVNRLKKEDIYYAQNYYGQTLNRVNDRASFLSMVADGLLEMSMHGLFIVQTHSTKKSEIANLIFGYRHNTYLDLPVDGIIFNPKEILPKQFWLETFEYFTVVEPLTSQDETLGYIIIEVDADNLISCDYFASQLAGTLIRLGIIEEMKLREVKLQNSLDQLQLAQKQLIEAEKMASLGQLVAGVAHEINTPLGVGVTGGSYLEEQIRIIKEAYNNQTMTKSMFNSFIEGAEESIISIMRNLERAADLVHSFKQVAVDQSSDANRQFNIKEYLREIILSLKSSIKKTQHEVIVDCDEDLIVNSIPGSFSQIFTNLIMNSIKHGFKDIKNGTITIQIRKKDDYLNITFKDNGKGMNHQIREHVFDPFFTTERGSGGSGLGMNIVYNLITQKLKGSISCFSEEKKGTTFYIAVPLDLDSPEADD